MKTRICLDNKRILITGSPGFIGANLVTYLLNTMKGGLIVSLDNMNPYYDVRLKEYRLQQIKKIAINSAVQHIFVKGDISNKEYVDEIFMKYHFDIVVNLAAQAGVRYSIECPQVYIDSNIIGFYNILEACRQYKPEHLVYASSSSVYGGNIKVPFSINDKVDCPVSLYAATKKTNELMAYCYAKLYDIPSTGLRFFTVYGPAGRPDMFYFSAIEKLYSRKKIQVYNYGKMERDFTYIDDVVEVIYRVMQQAPAHVTGKDGLPIAPYSIYNVGGEHPENILDFLQILCEELVKEGVLPNDYDFESSHDLVGMQMGDVPITYADCTELQHDFDYKPKVGIREGLHLFVKWYAEYYSGRF